MKDRIKWMLAGLGFTFGLQVIISLMFTGVAYRAARSGTSLGQDLALVVAFSLVVGAFLIGGFVIGWMNEAVRLVDSALVALAAISLSYLVYRTLEQGRPAQFVTGYLLSDLGRALLFISLALVAALVGAYWGWHVKVPQEGLIDRVALLVGLVGVVVGPFVLLAVSGGDPTNPSQPNLPWYFLAVVLSLVLVIVGVGFVMFTRESKYEDEISISPEHHKQLDQSRAAASEGR
jgi:hypothetical protein